MYSKVELIDNIEFMSRFPTNYFDLSFSDPPYGIKESSKKRGNFRVKQKNGAILNVNENIYRPKDWDDEPPGDDFFDELKRVSRNQAIWGANYFKQIAGDTFKAPRRAEYYDFLRINPVGWIIWDKVNGSNDFSDCELLWTSKPIKSHIVYYMWNGMMQGVYCGTDIAKSSIQQGNKQLNEKRIHPTQKPVILNRYLLKILADEGRSVLDPTMGSQSLRIAAHLEGYDYFGCENDLESFNLGNSRFENHLSNQRLFI